MDDCKYKTVWEHGVFCEQKSMLFLDLKEFKEECCNCIMYRQVKKWL